MSDEESRSLTHVDSTGAARMVDVGGKPATERVARAVGAIRMQAATLDAIRANAVAKGDVLAVAKIAGILAAKRAADLIPLCHPIPLTDIALSLTGDESLPGIRAECTVKATWKTGVEMEALTAITISLLTIYDMAKAIDRGMELVDISLVEKTGGKLGHWSRA